MLIITAGGKGRFASSWARHSIVGSFYFRFSPKTPIFVRLFYAHILVKNQNIFSSLVAVEFDRLSRIITCIERQDCIDSITIIHVFCHLQKETHANLTRWLAATMHLPITAFHGWSTTNRLLPSIVYPSIRQNFKYVFGFSSKL